MRSLNDVLLDIKDYLKRHRLVGSDFIEPRSTGDGIQLVLKGVIGNGGSSPSSSDIYLCKITGGSTMAGYTIDIYGDGYDNPATDSGLCEALPLAAASNITVGYPVVVYSSNVTLTGGTD